MTLAQIRDRALSPALYSDVVPEGVLKRIGLAAWEQPPSATGGGYMHWLHQLIEQTGHKDDYNLYLSSPIRSAPGFYTAARMQEMYDACLTGFGTMDVTQLDAGGTFDAGSALTLQNTIFAPVQTSQIAAATNYDYKPEIDLIRGHWAKSLTIHCGLANNPAFFTGSFYFNNKYPLKGRAAENVWRGFVDFTTYNIGASDYVYPLRTFGADANTYLWLKTSYDPTIPAVFNLCLDHVAGLVTEYGTNVRYAIHGENSLSIDTDPGSGGTGEIATNFSADAVAGFRKYMSSYLGLTIGQANSRWGTAYAAYADVDPSAAVFGANTVQYQDYRDYLSFVTGELGTLQQHKAIETNLDIESSCFRFGPSGMERSWLESRFGSVGDWIGQTTQEYLDLRDFGMNSTARAARLSGVPPAFPITAPPFIFVSDPPNQQNVPGVLRSYRTYSDAEMAILISDLMSCGQVNVAYLASPMAGFGADQASVEAVKRVLYTIRTAHSTLYARTGPLNRLCIQADTLDLSNSTTGTGGGRVAYWLSKREHHAQPALFTSDRVRTRTLAREALKRSVTVVAFPSTLVATKDDYVAMLPANANGAAILLAYSTGGLPAYVNPTPLETSWYGNLYNVKDGGNNPTNVFYFEVRLPTTCNRDTFFNGIAEVLQNQFINRAAQSIAPLGTIPWSRLPFTVLSDQLDEISVNYTTDGVNFTIHLTNLSQEPRTVVVTVNPSVATALGVTYLPFTAVIPPVRTTIAVIDAQFTGLDVAGAISDATTKLNAVGAGFDVSNGQELISQASSLLATNPARALAAYIAAARMPYIKVDWANPTLTTTVRRITLPTEGAGPENVSGARVQVVFPLNGREEQAVEATTNGSGVATIAVGSPAVKRWSITSLDMVTPGAGANDIVEVHVTDSRGMSTRAVKATP